jgi:hypothetical protein
MFPSGPVHRHRTAHLRWSFGQPLQAEFPPGCTYVMEFLIARTIQPAAVDEQLFCGVVD